ncbi:transmembrane protein 272-like isoform X2 [Acanthopagrus latus]|uniref:transmembrane protein 272-like isoform X2 n=1 Tax=Acanthopagrus latus TaxID=8177 RepID=UPI00187C1BA9|nr:transmembrane protein 272-like isoform X2 [Acanthopagrus latus]
MSVEIQGTFKTSGPSAAAQEIVTVTVATEGVASTGNDKKSGGFGASLIVNALFQIGIGGYFHHNCPVQPYIPIYMEVMGTVTIVTVIAYWWYNDSPKNYLVITILTLGLLFCFCFFITGGVWIYSIYPPNYDNSIPHLIPYCNRTLYLFAFIDTTIFCVLAGLTILSGCCCCVFKCVSMM